MNTATATCSFDIGSIQGYSQITLDGTVGQTNVRFNIDVTGVVPGTAHVGGAAPSFQQGRVDLSLYEVKNGLIVSPSTTSQGLPASGTVIVSSANHNGANIQDSGNGTINQATTDFEGAPVTISGAWTC